ncbi:hypothetical protein B0F90DRAFT_292109 [Multifurca ochricompacta]|uniref:Uncharacterized protein n=1 Tax=Multifurca ochricompacta TaxID=376703 RepID=A0AAD4M624_9AGAM|nr:hypothetical protein B0F90DRAFT_292109 [Multifurca ochricompacta]
MLVSSKHFPEATEMSDNHTLILRHGSRSVLVLLPESYQELLTITREIFDVPHDSTPFFETSDLDICQDAAVEIHPGAWKAVALTVTSVVVKDQVSSSPRGGGDEKPLQLSRTPGRISLTPRHAHKTASGSSNEATQFENGPGTSYDDVRDSIPTDDLAEEELESGYDDDFDDTPALPKRRGKPRTRIESDGEDEYEEEHVDGLLDVKTQLSTSPYRLQSSQPDPSFSVAPSSPKHSASVASMQGTVRASARDLFSPKVKSGLTNSTPPPAVPGEEHDNAKLPIKPARKPTAVASDASPRTEKTLREPAPKSALLKKDAQNGSPVQPKFKPRPGVVAPLDPAPAQSTLPAQPSDKILITIRHLPTEKENKFKVKTVHTVGRVLTSACAAFGLNANIATLMLWTEEDGLEMSYPCENDLQMGNLAGNGTIFVIELAK